MPGMGHSLNIVKNQLSFQLKKNTQISVKSLDQLNTSPMCEIIRKVAVNKQPIVYFDNHNILTEYQPAF